MSVAPTVMALAALAGEKVQASAVLLPAAMAYTTPAALELSTAWLSAVDSPPPRLMFAADGTDGVAFFCAVTQSMPAITPEGVPRPEQSGSGTATRCHF